MAKVCARTFLHIGTLSWLWLSITSPLSWHAMHTPRTRVNGKWGYRPTSTTHSNLCFISTNQTVSVYRLLNESTDMRAFHCKCSAEADWQVSMHVVQTSTAQTLHYLPYSRLFSWGTDFHGICSWLTSAKNWSANIKIGLELVLTSMSGCKIPCGAYRSAKI